MSPPLGNAGSATVRGGFLWIHVLSGRGISGTMSLLGVMVSAQGVCMFKGVGTHPPWIHGPAILRDMVDKRVVHILLECFLYFIVCCCCHHHCYQLQEGNVFSCVCLSVCLSIEILL